MRLQGKCAPLLVLDSGRAGTKQFRIRDNRRTHSHINRGSHIPRRRGSSLSPPHFNYWVPRHSLPAVRQHCASKPSVVSRASFKFQTQSTGLVMKCRTMTGPHSRRVPGSTDSECVTWLALTHHHLIYTQRSGSSALPRDHSWVQRSSQALPGTPSVGPHSVRMSRGRLR